MPSYQRSTTVDVAPDRLFAYLSDVENLPKYFDRMTEAHPAGGHAVETTAVIPDEEHGGQREVHGEAWFEVHEDRQRIEWGSEGSSGYRGALDVTPEGDGARIALELHTEHDHPGVEEGIDRTLATIAEQVTGGA